MKSNQKLSEEINKVEESLKREESLKSHISLLQSQLVEQQVNYL